MSDWRPTQHDLQQAPELAALAVLEAAAETTQVALLAAHPDLWEAPHDKRDHSVSADVAKMLYRLLDGLRDKVLLYRFALDRDARQRSADAIGPGSRARNREAEQSGKAAGKTAKGAA